MQDVLDFLFVAAAFYAWRAPVPWLVKLYLEIQAISVLVYLGMKLNTSTNEYSEAYAFSWWLLTGLQILMPIIMACACGRAMFKDPILRVILASWALWFIWFYGYWQAPRSTALDWCPDVIFTFACLIIRRLALAAEVGSQSCIPDRL